MTLCPRLANRAAALLCHKLIRRRCAEGDRFFLPDYAWQRVKAAHRMAQRARERGWLGAVRRINQELVSGLDYLHSQLNHLLAALDKQADLLPLPSQSDVARDILALEYEFTEVALDLKLETISVVTDDIVLEGVSFGPFEIRLDLKALSASDCYRVIALAPNRAESDEKVTHPHVMSDQLCEGEGHQAIRTALTEGRLADFFLLVHRVLSTYALGSAYVELRHWSADRCEECDDSISPYDGGTCAGCDATVCANCHTSCAACQTGYCGNCLIQCRGCQAWYCATCSTHCSGCQAAHCVSCLTDGRCPACQPKSSPNPIHVPEFSHATAETAALAAAP